MARLSNEIWSVIDKLGGNTAKIVRIAKNNAAYEQAVKRIWTNPEAASIVLDHTNAFYVREDTRPRKGPHDGPVYICEVCSDDALVRSELDTHRELLQLALKEQGLTFEELKIIPARRGMKSRHPFSNNTG